MKDPARIFMKKLLNIVASRENPFKRTVSLACAIGLMGAASHSFAADRAGSKDHPLFSRYKGVEIRDYATREFDRIERTPVNCESASCKASPNFKTGTFIAEGKITEITYQTPDFSKISLLQALRNYQAAVKELGGEWLNPTERANSYHVFSIPSVKGDAKSAPVFLTLNFTYGDDKYDLAVIEPAKVEQSVKAGELSKQLASQGFATIYVNFATGKFDVPAEAKGTVSEIAAMLSKEPKLNISVEGHTDNVGSAKDNELLSAKRAASIVNALVTAGIAKGRLKSKGLGQSAPIADNRGDEGRSKNRRVELVKF
jgi:OmpA-OmpF porin, OOP family